jgi:hypothetical protein
MLLDFALRRSRDALLRSLGFVYGFLFSGQRDLAALNPSLKHGMGFVQISL